MNPSVLIFVALAVAWLAYLIPKALEHTEAAERTRAVVDFSHRLRVLGRREPVAATKPAKPGKADKDDERVSAPERGAEPAASRRDDVPATQAAAPAPAAVPPTGVAEGYLDRSSYNRAARRRRNVLTSLVVLLFVVAVLAVFGALPMMVVAGPVVLLAAWLVACRLMVRRARPARRPAARPAGDAVGGSDEDGTEPTSSITLRPAPNGIEEDGRPHESDEATADDPNGWDPVRVPLPTYVAKPAARRAVRTIDLDGTGVWSSGRNESDSALARSAEAAAKDEPGHEERRKTS